LTKKNKANIILKAVVSMAVIIAVIGFDMIYAAAMFLGLFMTIKQQR